MEDIRHGIDGWLLVQYEWDPNRGSFFQYERIVEQISGERTLEVRTVVRQQKAWSV